MCNKRMNNMRIPFIKTPSFTFGVRSFSHTLITYGFFSITRNKIFKKVKNKCKIFRRNIFPSN